MGPKLNSCTSGANFSRAPSKIVNLLLQHCGRINVRPECMAAQRSELEWRGCAPVAPIRTVRVSSCLSPLCLSLLATQGKEQEAARVGLFSQFLWLVCASGSQSKGLECGPSKAADH